MSRQDIPSTSRLFSGNRFPLEILSSMGFHISSRSASAVPGRSWLPGIRDGKFEVRRVLIAEVLRSLESCCWALRHRKFLATLCCDVQVAEQAGAMQRRVNVKRGAGACLGCLSSPELFCRGLAGALPRGSHLQKSNKAEVTSAAHPP